MGLELFIQAGLNPPTLLALAALHRRSRVTLPPYWLKL